MISKIKLIIIAALFFLLPIIAFAKFCIYCGAKNPDEAVFCISCGKKFPASSPEKIKTQQIPEITISQNDFSLLQKRAEGVITAPFFTFLKDQNTFIVREILDKNSDSLSNIKQGDIITTIADNPVINFNSQNLDMNLNKTPGTKFNISLFRKDENKKYDVSLTAKEFSTPGIIQISSAKDSPVYHIFMINKNTPDEFKKILIDADKNNCKEIILDVRCCISFSDSQPAIQMLNMLLTKGEIVGAITNPDDTKETIITKDNPITFIPITIITDDTVECLAEWFAASLRINQRAKIVGGKTAGKLFTTDWNKTEKKTYTSFIKTILSLPPSKSFSETGLKPDILIPNNISSMQWVNWYLSKDNK